MAFRLYFMIAVKKLKLSPDSQGKKWIHSLSYVQHFRPRVSKDKTYSYHNLGFNVYQSDGVIFSVKAHTLPALPLLSFDTYP